MWKNVFLSVHLVLVNYLAKPILAQVAEYTATTDQVYPAQLGCMNMVSGKGQLATYGTGVVSQLPISEVAN